MAGNDLRSSLDAAPARFDGWRVVGALAIAQGCGVGLIQAYSPLLNPIAREFGVPAGEMGRGMAIFLLAMTGVGVVLGPIVDRGWVRGTMMIGVALMFGGLWWMTHAETALQLVAGVAIASVGIALYGPLPANATIVRWFTEKRGTALAIVAAGPAVAGFGIPIAVASVIVSDGWREAVWWLGLGAAAIALPVIWFAVRATPALVGQMPDGGSAGDVPPEKDESVSVSPFLATRDFWLLGIGIALTFAVPIGMGIYLVPFLEESGVGLERASIAISVGAVFGFIGTITSGVLADRFSPKAVLIALLAVSASAYTVLALWPGFEVALIAAAGMGIGTGGAAPLHPLFVGRRFGPAVVGRVIGIQGLVGLPVLVAAPLVAGAAHDAFGRYEPAFLGAAGVFVGAAIVLAFFRLDPPVPPG